MPSLLRLTLGVNSWPELFVHAPGLILRTTLIFLVVLAVVRWTGKRTISALAPFDLAVVIMVGEVAAIPLSDMRVDLLHGVLPVVLLALFHVILTTVNLHYKAVEELTEGKATLLVKNGRPVRRNLRLERVSMADLHAALRLQGVTDLNQVQEAWMEHSGGVSVLLRPEARPVTVGDLRQVAGPDPRQVEAIIERHLMALRQELTAMTLGPEAKEERPPVQPN